MSRRACIFFTIYFIIFSFFLPAENQQDEKTNQKIFLLDYAPIELYTPPQQTKKEEYDIFYKDEKGRTPLMLALMQNDFHLASILIENGASTSEKDNDGWTPLMYAVRFQNKIETINLLINNGAKIRVQNELQTSPLLLCAEYNPYKDVLELLLKAYDESEDAFYKAFIFTITSSSVSNTAKKEKILAFIKKGINLNRFWEGKTPLMYAAEKSSSTEILQILIQNGAKINARDSNGKNAFDFAKKNPSLKKDSIYWSLNKEI